MCLRIKKGIFSGLVCSVLFKKVIMVVLYRTLFYLFIYSLQTKNWVVDTVLERISQVDRSVVFCQLLRLAEVSARVFNFNSAFNILSGLRYLHFPRIEIMFQAQSTYIYRVQISVWRLPNY